MHRRPSLTPLAGARSSAALALTGLAAGLALGGSAGAQSNFSIDYIGPTISVPDSFTGMPITEGDILAPATGGNAAFGPLPPPGMVQTGGFGAPAPGLLLGVHAGCVGHPPGFPCRVEVDALSYGLDHLVRPNFPPTWLFSVDRFALGQPGAPAFPNVTSEAGCVTDAATDVFRDLGLPPGPLCPATPPAGGGNTGVVDGDGLASCNGALYPGLGLKEPGVPGSPPDNVDAYDFGTHRKPKRTFFSLDAGFVDPFTGIAHTSSAFAHGFVGGDVLVSAPGGAAPTVYAPAIALGLDSAGPDTDDLDALILVENGVPGFQPSSMPYDWVGGATDMLMFSVRRGSAVIGALDSLCGLPIEEGDILVPPLVAGGPPGIFIAAEWLGLLTTRSFPGIRPDDIDALDVRQANPTGVPFCFGDGLGTPCPCGNHSFPGADEGCLHSGGTGGALRAEGNAQVSNDTVTLYLTGLPPTSPALYFQGTALVGGGLGAPFGDGLRCVGGTIRRLGTKVSMNGSSCFGFGVPGDPLVSVAGAVPAAGGLFHYQAWYRNNAAFCTPMTFNLTNGYSIPWAP